MGSQLLMLKFEPASHLSDSAYLDELLPIRSCYFHALMAPDPGKTSEGRRLGGQSHVRGLLAHAVLISSSFCVLSMWV